MGRGRLPKGKTGFAGDGVWPHPGMPPGRSQTHPDGDFETNQVGPVGREDAPERARRPRRETTRVRECWFRAWVDRAAPDRAAIVRSGLRQTTGKDRGLRTNESVYGSQSQVNTGGDEADEVYRSNDDPVGPRIRASGGRPRR